MYCTIPCGSPLPPSLLLFLFYFAAFAYVINYFISATSPIGWNCRICRLHLCRGAGPLPQRVSWIYDTKPSVGEAPVQELGGMWSTTSLLLLLNPLWPGVGVPVRVLVKLICLIIYYTWSYLAVYKQMIDAKLNYLC